MCVPCAPAQSHELSFEVFVKLSEWELLEKFSSPASWTMDATFSHQIIRLKEPVRAKMACSKGPESNIWESQVRLCNEFKEGVTNRQQST